MCKKIIFLLCVIAFVSCHEEAEIEKEIAEVPVEFEVVRFDRQFAEAKPGDIPELKQQYPFLFP
ncbi:MAG: gliding motility lipoprotein GldB, partial [Salegentibacter mishustinae]|nr:gliding motility lipoprotein GldB [Salegentibacter mishustinae]